MCLTGKDSLNCGKDECDKGEKHDNAIHLRAAWAKASLAAANELGLFGKNSTEETTFKND